MQNPWQSNRFERAKTSIQSQSRFDERMSHLAINDYNTDSPFRASTPSSPRRRLSPQRGRKHRSCPYQALCYEYISSLNWPHVYFNNAFDRCYCNQCYPEYKCNSYIVANAPYVIPRGWVRIGLYVDEVKAKIEDIWNTWIISYHGTNVAAAQSIVSHRQFLLNGDTCENGQQLGKRCEDLYTSPTIKYSARDAYAKSAYFRSESGTLYSAKVVFQCRQKPGTYSTQGATGRAQYEKKLCDVIPNDKIELYTNIRSSVVPYGLMVRLIEINA